MRLIILSILLGTFVSLIGADAIVDPSLLRALEEEGRATAIVSFRNSKSDSLRKSLVFPRSATRAQRTSAIYRTLKSHADEVQASVAGMVSEYQRGRAASSNEPIRSIQLWINNQLVIYNADLALVGLLQGMDEVSEIMSDSFVYLEKPIVEEDSEEGYVPRDSNVAWGVGAIQAPEVWATGNKGAGIVIASTDSGVRVTHEALRDNWRSENGWYDPASGSLTPWDANGHGTHTIGTIVGSKNGIGVAPEAKFIACRACDGSCPYTCLVACGQWAVCPTDPEGKTPRCDLAPNAVSNSWGGDQEDTYYDATIQTWIQAGITPLFSAGNDGSKCSSSISPGDSGYAISIGATDNQNQVIHMSSRGPTNGTARRLKPDIVAPGAVIFSAAYNADDSYASMTGTSMACPHVAGLAALLYHQRSDLSVEQVKAALLAGAQPIQPSNGNCGGIDESTYPNNAAGQGQVSAPASVEALNTILMFE